MCHSEFEKRLNLTRVSLSSAAFAELMPPPYLYYHLVHENRQYKLYDILNYKDLVKHNQHTQE